SGGGVNAVKVVDVARAAVVATISTGTGSPRDSALADGVLTVMLTSGELMRIAATGATSTITDVTPLSAGPSDLAVARDRGTAVVTQPTLDGVDVVSLVPCDTDLDGDATVGFTDLLLVLATWGPCPGCPADIDGDGLVGFTDLLAVLADWGPCP
ncbi:MAG: hypothetical protein HKO59_16960, partial [Phycisphaerales bacterium]|nr:hypothetical protein [Phycisphaerales bacterium]